MFGTVLDVRWPTPGYASITFGGDGLRGFVPSPFADSYVNVAIPPAGAPYAPPFELDDLKALDTAQRPFRRRYTVRRFDAERGELTLDFVVHGDEGAGGGWARRAREGDALVFTGPAGGWSPDPGAAWHLLVGDESALPAIAAGLDALADDAPAFVRVLCDGPEFELELPGRADVAWRHRTGDPSDADLLADAVGQIALPDGPGDAFVHGEAAETRAVRRHLLADRGLAPAGLSCSPYWRRGYDDEAWRTVKAAWNADVARDVPLG